MPAAKSVGDKPSEFAVPDDVARAQAAMGCPLRGYDIVPCMPVTPIDQSAVASIVVEPTVSRAEVGTPLTSQL